MKLLIASNNKGKVREYQTILHDFFPNLILLSLREAGIEHDVEETGTTFEENARLKAAEYSALSGLPVIADDSGLAVEAFDGFPGVYSARWAGPTDADRNQQLLIKMADLTGAQRAAKFVCTIVFRLPDGREAVASGDVRGHIGHEARGEHGFGYDPLFVLPDGRHMAELKKEEKNQISHRGQAAKALVPRVLALLGPSNERSAGGSS